MISWSNLSVATLGDIEALRDSKRPEDRFIDYKRDLPGGSDKERHEFCADVTAFANSFGGVQIFGVDEERDHDDKPTGIPSEIVGCDVPNWDALNQWFTNVVVNGVSPRLPHFDVVPIEFSPGKLVVLVGAGRSVASPHAVTLSGSPKFYLRDSKGKHPMDVSELRYAFLQSGDFVRDAESYRDERLSRIANNQAPVQIAADSYMVVNIVPMGEREARLDFLDSEIREAAMTMLTTDLAAYDPIFTFDGFCCYYDPRGASAVEYSVISDWGGAEWYSTSILKDQVIYIDQLENSIAKFVIAWVDSAVKNAIAPPIAVFVSLFGADQHNVRFWNAPTPGGIYGDLRPISRNPLLIPPAIINDMRAFIPFVLRPLFNRLSNAVGLARSCSFDSNRKWKWKDTFSH